MKKKRRKAISEWFSDFKQTLSCAHCGNDDFRTLEFHHKNPDEKDFNLGDAKHHGLSKDRIMREAKKCDVLCANCHRIHHYEERCKATVG